MTSKYRDDRDRVRIRGFRILLVGKGLDLFLHVAEAVNYWTLLVRDGLDVTLPICGELGVVFIKANSGRRRVYTGDLRP